MERADKIQLSIAVIMLISLLISSTVSIYQVSQINKERRYATFINLLDRFDSISEKHSDVWSDIQVSFGGNENRPDNPKQYINPIQYLVIKSNQNGNEPLYAIEYDLLDIEINSLNLLNSLCELSIKDKLLKDIIVKEYWIEIIYYKNLTNDLSRLYEKEKLVRIIPKPESNCLTDLEIES